MHCTEATAALTTMFEMTMIFEILTIALPATLGRALVLIRKAGGAKGTDCCAGRVALIWFRTNDIDKAGQSELAVLSTQIEMVAMVVPPAM